MATISNSIFWKDVSILHLSMNMRISQQNQDPSDSSSNYNQYAKQFAAWLLEIGEGKRNQDTKVNLLPHILSS